MKKFFKYVLTVVMTVASGFTAVADETEEMEFEPIHSTIMPGNGTLKFEEVYGKKASITSNGDALMFKVGKAKNITTNNVILPVNAFQDYSIEFTFQILKGDGFISVGSSDYGIMFGKKLAILFSNNGNQPVKKWKTPQGETKGQVILKIVRKKNIVTFFLNEKYVGELTVKPKQAVLPLVISCVGIKSFDFELQSIRIDQGPEGSSDD